MRIACPPLIYACPFIGFTSSKSPLELITRRIIKELEGDENKNLDKYAKTDSVIASKKLFDTCGVKYRKIELSGKEIKLDL